MIYRIIVALIMELSSLAIKANTSEEFKKDLRKCITELDNIKKYF